MHKYVVNLFFILFFKALQNTLVYFLEFSSVTKLQKTGMELLFSCLYIYEKQRGTNKPVHQKAQRNWLWRCKEEQEMATNNMKEFVDELRTDWQNLWRNRVEDKVRAEGIAKRDYSKLFVEQGTVIMATRDFKPLEFFDIVKEYLECDTEKVIPPNSTIGGWGKFIRTNIRNQKPATRASKYVPPKKTPKKGQQQKRGGRGWLSIKLK